MSDPQGPPRSTVEDTLGVGGPLHPVPASSGRRIGIAIPVPDPLGELLQRRRAESGDRLAWSVPTHVTLVPPVVVAEAHLPEVDAHLAGVAAGTEPFAIRLHGTGTFRPVSPVVYVRLTAGGAQVAGLEERVRSGVLGSPRRFPFHPHVTLAQDLADEALDAAEQALSGFEAAFDVDCLVLYRHDGDGVWRPVADYALG